MIVTLAAVAMMHDDDAKDVFGSLPRRRPAIESPRRARTREATAKAPSGPPRPPAPASAHSELEGIARAGARLAAGAAASGLKLAGRTVGGLGRVVGRR